MRGRLVLNGTTEIRGPLGEISTTHVSLGAIFGIGVLGKKQNGKVVRSILLSWLITLPVAALASAVAYALANLVLTS